MISFLIAIALIALFHVGLKCGILARMNGPAWAEHSHAILLIAVPLSWWTWLVWVVGITLYLDDTVQHYRRAHGKPQYKSWVHVNGWWYIQRPIFEWLKIGG